VTAEILPQIDGGDRSTVAARASLGRSARVTAPRSSHAELRLSADRAPLARLAEQESSRLPDLVPVRQARMAASPLAFFRGGAAVMAHDLASTPSSGLRAQLSGDAHLSNFGAFASPERDLVFDLNDFDETLPGPFEWDVKRLAASLEVAGRERSFDDAERAAAVTGAVRAYRRAMRGFAALGDLDVWYARLDARAIADRLREAHDVKLMKSLRHIVAKARAYDGRRQLATLTHEVDGEPRIVSEPPLIVPLAELGAQSTESLLRLVVDAYDRSLPADRRVLLGRYRLVDLARKVAGVGSVGTRCWIVLLLGRDERDPLFLQVKEAQASVLEPFLGPGAVASHGRRVVEGQRLMQASSDIFLGWTRGEADLDGRRDYYLRQLRDWKVSLDVETILPHGLSLYGRACAWTLARAHARSGDRVAIASYLGSADAFDRAVAAYAAAYADVNEDDHRALKRAVGDGSVAAVSAGPSVPRSGATQPAAASPPPTPT
jgi:uncharacterized protein (DUF2252 family)